MGRSIFRFALASSFLVMIGLVITDLNDIHLDRNQLLNIFYCWILGNLLFILIKIISHE